MKAFLLGLVSTLVGAFLFFSRKKSEIPQKDPKIAKLDDKAESLKAEIKGLQSQAGKPVGDKTLQEEVDYWKK